MSFEVHCFVTFVVVSVALLIVLVHFRIDLAVIIVATEGAAMPTKDMVALIVQGGLNSPCDDC